ncbi:hypothetical protein HZS_4052 [Henneguya salminicola]|nr:hypothetical protein HZS_4052 [Henneguya salminicola]
MEANFVFNGRLYRKSLTKTKVTYYKCSNCDRCCPARLIVRINKISEKSKHNWEANCLMIQIPAQNLSPESVVDTLIFERAFQLNLYPNQILRDLLLTMRDQFVHTPYIPSSKINYQRRAGFNRNKFDRSSYVSSIKSFSKQPTFFSSFMGLRYSWSSI